MYKMILSCFFYYFGLSNFLAMFCLVIDVSWAGTSLTELGEGKDVAMPETEVLKKGHQLHRNIMVKLQSIVFETSPD